MGKSVQELVDDAINAKKVEIEKLDSDIADKTARVDKLNKELEEAKNLFNANEAKSKSATDRTAQTLEDTRKELTETIEKIEAEKLQLQSDKDALAIEKDNVEKIKRDNLEALETSKQLDSEIESKTNEAKRLSQARKDELGFIEEATQAQQIEIKRNERLKEEIETLSKANRKTLDRIKEAQSDASAGQEIMQAERASLELLRNNANQIIASSEYAKNMASNLITVFRQTLHQYIQINGSAIQIPNLTPEIKKFIAETLLSEIWEVIAKAPETVKTVEKVEEIETIPAETPEIKAETPKTAPDEEVLTPTIETKAEDEKIVENEVETVTEWNETLDWSEWTDLWAESNEKAPETSETWDEIADIVALRKQYTEKFGKSPFNGWNASQLLEKINTAI